jgi:hypothetical protein
VFGSVWRELSAKVVDRLVKAEIDYSTEIDTDKPNVGFAKAVEASLQHCLVDPLDIFMKKRRLRQIDIPDRQDKKP